MRQVLVSLTLLAALLLSACGRERVVAPAPRVVDDTLCLASTGTASPELVDLTANARRQPQLAAVWIATGRGWAAQAFARASAGEMLQVAACARAAQGREPGSVAALELLASVALNAHRFDEALALSDQALAIAPDDVNSLGIRSDALLELGRYREAALAARRQMQIWPGAAAQARAAHFHWLAGDVEAAKRGLIAALRGRDARTPAFNAWLWSEVGRIYQHEGEYTDAAAMYRRSLAELPDYPPALLGAARAALGQGDAAAARDFAQAALEAAASVESAIALGDALFALGERAAAEATWRRAEDLGRRGDTLGLARFLNERGRDPARALKLLRRESASRGSLEMTDALAFAQFRAGDCQRASRTLAPLLALGVRDARVLLHGARIERGCGDLRRAQALYELAGQLDRMADHSAAHALAAQFGVDTEVAGR